MIIENSEVILSVRDLTANVDGNQILKGVNLELKAGEMVLVRVLYRRFWLDILLMM